MQELYRRLEFSLVKRRIERGAYFWSINTQDLAEEEARCSIDGELFPGRWSLLLLCLCQ
jgi:hypothetical protein